MLGAFRGGRACRQPADAFVWFEALFKRQREASGARAGAGWASAAYSSQIGRGADSFMEWNPMSGAAAPAPEQTFFQNFRSETTSYEVLGAVWRLRGQIPVPIDEFGEYFYCFGRNPVPAQIPTTFTRTAENAQQPGLHRRRPAHIPARPPIIHEQAVVGQNAASAREMAAAGKAKLLTLSANALYVGRVVTSAAAKLPH